MAGLVTAPTGEAAVREAVPEEQAGPPFYARVGGAVTIHTADLAAIPFYRDPACVPAGFNLLRIFDVPTAFRCPLTVEGFEVWENGPPPQDRAPIQSKLHGTGAVPVWIVSWPELEAAMADGGLTIVELAALPSLEVGYAEHFSETLHPLGGAQQGLLQLTAHGQLVDGQTFRVHVAATERSLAQGADHASIEIQ